MNLKSAPATLALGTLGLVLLAALGWVTLVGPAFGTIGETDDARVETQDRNAAMGLQLATLRRQAADLPRLRELAGRLDQVFPPTADQPGFFEEVTGAAADAGIPEESVVVVSPTVPEILLAPEETAAPEGAPEEVAEPAAAQAATEPAPAEVGDLAVQTVTIEVGGTYEQYTDLLANLAEMDRAILITAVSLETDEERSSLIVTGTTFVAPPLEDPEQSGRDGSGS